MRILVANKFWYHRGGLERVMFDEVAWLEEAGHEVAHFSTAHPRNEPSPWSDYFAPYVELGEGARLGPGAKLLAATRMFYNREAAKRFTRLLVEFNPDIVHVHGIHRQLSPSILLAATDRSVPVIQTLHDYWPICPADVLLRRNGAVCDPSLCRTTQPWACSIHRCVGSSALRSALSAAEAWTRESLLGYQNLVTVFISPSYFLRTRVQAAGFAKRPIIVVQNAIRERTESKGGDGFVYAGRLSREKGVHVLLEAARQAGVSLTIAGDGPLAPELRRQAGDHACFVGSVSPAAVSRLLDECAAAVVPSTWFENAPLAVLEPMASGTPVIASSIGGIPEMIRAGVDGVLVTPGSVAELRDALLAAQFESSRMRAFAASARSRTRTLFSPDSHLAGLLAVYEEASRLAECSA